MRDERGFNLSSVWFIIAVNIVLFIFTSLYEDLIYQFGLQPSSFTREPWTILTNLFIHADFFHIFGNMVTFYFFGTYVLLIVGERNFLITYFLGGLLGNAAFIVWALYAPWASPDAPNTIAIGASGAVFALGGALAVLRPTAKVALFFLIPMPLWVGVLVAFLFLTILSLAFPISWQAHLGGLVLGLAVGLIFRRNRRYRFLR